MAPFPVTSAASVVGTQMIFFSEKPILLDEHAYEWPFPAERASGNRNFFF